MKSKAIISVIAAATLGFASLSFAQGHDRRGPGAEQPRGEQRGPMARDGRDADHRGYDRQDHRNRPNYGGRDAEHRDYRHRQGHGGRDFDRHDVRRDGHYGARGPQFYRGGRIPAEYRNRQYVVTNWQPHHLSAPPRNHQWVQVGADYALIAIATGVIAQLVLSQ